MPFYGINRRPGDAVADFLLGGNRKRLIVERLAGRRAYTATTLMKELEIGRSTVFETIRVLRGADALEERGDAVRLTSKTPLGKALRALVRALAETGDAAVDRPPRPGRSAHASTRRPST